MPCILLKVWNLSFTSIFLGTSRSCSWFQTNIHRFFSRKVWRVWIHCKRGTGLCNWIQILWMTLWVGGWISSLVEVGLEKGRHILRKRGHAWKGGLKGEMEERRQKEDPNLDSESTESHHSMEATAVSPSRSLGQGKAPTTLDVISVQLQQIRDNFCFHMPP